MCEVSNEPDFQRELDNHLLNLSRFGVCRSDNTGCLLEAGYLTGSLKWFKPIIGAVDYYQLTEKAKERVLSLEIEALNDKSDPIVCQDAFTQVDWTQDNYNSLIFTPQRIMAEIVKGNSEQIAKSSLGQTWMNAKLGRQSPELTSKSNPSSRGGMT